LFWWALVLAGAGAWAVWNFMQNVRGEAAEAGRQVFSDQGISEETGEEASPSDGAGEGGEDASEPEAAGDDDLGRGGVTQVALPTDLGRDIIFTAQVAVAVPDVGDAGDQATRAVESLGGFLFGQRTTGSPEPRTELTFKVPPESFQEALARLGDIGEVRTQEVTADDVTERIVDLESRINTAVASVERLRTLLSQATDIEAIVDLENELLERETELETLRGSLRTLQNQVALATIVLTLTEAESQPAVEVRMSAYPSHDDGGSCPGSEGLTVEQNTEATVCVEVFNVGDTWLDEFELRDPVLDIELDDMIMVFGDPTVAMEPGDSMLLAVEVNPDRDLRTRTTLTAIPVSADGEELPDPPASATVTLFIATVDPGGIATFGEGLEASWDLLVDLGRVALLMLGALIPFIWVPVLAVLGWRLWRNRFRPEARLEEPAAAADDNE
jgi:hypothetical protein